MLFITTLLIFYFSILSVETNNKEKEILADANATAVIEKIDHNLYERFGDVRAFAINKLGVEAVTTKTSTLETKHFINKMVEFYRLYDAIFIVDLQGDIVASNSKDINGKTLDVSCLKDVNFSKKDWFKKCISGKRLEEGAIYTEFIIDSISAKLNQNSGEGMAFAAPIQNAKGEILGVWYNFANKAVVIKELRTEIQSDINKDFPGTFILVTNAENRVIDSDDKSLHFHRLKLQDLTKKKGNFRYLGKTIDPLNYVVGSAISIGAYQYKGNQWKVFTFIPKSEFTFAKFIDKLFVLFYSVLGICLVLIVLFYWFAKRLSKKINLLREDILVLATGNLVHLHAIDENNEIGQMSLALNKLVKGLKEKSDFAIEIGKGNYDANFTVASELDQLGLSLLKMKEDLIEAQNVSQNSLKTKELFLANMSHEIRTPMNSIIGFTNLLLKSQTTEKQEQYLSYVKVNASNLLVIINDILDFSKIEAGKIELESIPFSLVEIANQVMQVCIEKAKDNQTTFHLKTSTISFPQVVGDPTRLYQILLNLISNSVKFTTNGKVELIITQKQNTSNICSYLFEVKDTGIGIPQDKIDKIFDSFTQATDSTTRKHGGTGLGLSIVKQLVELHGSEIIVKSQEGIGTTFSFEMEYLIQD